jgi:hypothetical protein
MAHPRMLRREVEGPFVPFAQSPSSWSTVSQHQQATHNRRILAKMRFLHSVHVRGRCPVIVKYHGYRSREPPCLIAGGPSGAQIAPERGQLVLERFLANNRPGMFGRRVNTSASRILPPVQQHLTKEASVNRQGSPSSVTIMVTSIGTIAKRCTLTANPVVAPVSEAQLHISSTPTDADIEIDGNFVGNTPSTVGVAAGQHQLVVKKSGYKPWEKNIAVSSGQVKVDAVLEAESK